jgi:hypothetical protein
VNWLQIRDLLVNGMDTENYNWCMISEYKMSDDMIKAFELVRAA